MNDPEGKMTDVIVVGRHYAITLAVVRSLGEAGYGVRLLALSNYAARIAGKSKYVRRICRAETDYDDMYRGLETLRGSDERILAIPLNDVACLLLNRHEEQLDRHYDIPRLAGSPGGMEAFMDKLAQKELARQCGLPVASGRAYSTDEEGIRRAVGEAAYPCFQKPLASVASHTGSKACFAKCTNADELRDAMRMAAAQECGTVLLEEFLPIEKELTAYGVAANGRVYLPACMEALRGGVNHLKGVAAEGVVRSAGSLGEMKGKLEEFVRRSGLTGLFCIDLIQSGGRLYFTEMNLRAGGSAYAITLAGANLPGALADMAYDRAAGGPEDIRREVHFLNEFIEFAAYMDRCLSWRDYRLHLSGGQERLVKSADDPRAWRAYQRLVVVKSRALRLLGLR
jgi:predicted ATP-grasp superfamily ATP-dependent carboligase